MTLYRVDHKKKKKFFAMCDELFPMCDELFAMCEEGLISLKRPIKVEHH